MELKAIETVYRGYRFRSRLEARWAVFFDSLGVRYEYEKEGYDLGDAGWYLPDFWLPEIGWIEIKAKRPTNDEWYKAESLARATDNDVFIFSGPIPQVSSQGLETEYDSACVIFANEGGDYHYLWCECPKCGMLGIKWSGLADRLSCQCVPSDYYGSCSQRLATAYAAARGARFEHGEQGIPKSSAPIYPRCICGCGCRMSRTDTCSCNCGCTCAYSPGWPDPE